MINKLQLQYNAISKMVDLVNKEFFDNQLSNIAITLQGGGAGSKNSYGWFWAERWTSKNEKVHELNITAESIDNILQLFITVHHELIHLYAKVNDIQDTSRQGRWHNKAFQKLCDKFGLFFVKDKSIGTRTPHTAEEGVTEEYIEWVTRMTKEIKEIDTWLSSGDIFKRVATVTVAKPKTSKTYQCSNCEEKVSLKIELVETLGEWYCPYCDTRNMEE